MNRNVKLSFLFMLFEIASNSIRTGDIFSVYVFKITNDNTQVGLLQMAVGVSMVFSAFPAGWLADMFKRHSILRLSTVFCAIGVFTYSIQILFNLNYNYLYIGSVFFGLYWGMYTPPFEAIFADSVPVGESKYFTYRYIVGITAYSLGTLVSVVSFAIIGNEWKIKYLQYNLFIGLSLAIPGMIFLALISDSYAIDVTQVQGTSKPNGVEGTLQNSEEEVNGKKVEDEQSLEDQKADKAISKHDQDQIDRSKEGLYEVHLADYAMQHSWYYNNVVPKFIRRIGFIPFTILISDIIASLASGMTLKFFALFFIDQCHLSPVYVFAVALTAQVLLVGFLQAVQVISSNLGFGKYKTNLISKALDIILLFVMAWLPTDSEPIKHILIVVHILRLGFANGILGINKAFLMQYTPKEVRSRWNAFDSIRSFSWSGSAAIGGFLAQTIGYQNMFQVTAAVKIFSLLPFIPLFFYIPDGKKRFYTGPKRINLGDNSLQESLLGQNSQEVEQEKVEQPKV